MSTAESSDRKDFPISDGTGESWIDCGRRTAAFIHGVSCDFVLLCAFWQWCCAVQWQRTRHSLTIRAGKGRLALLVKNRHYTQNLVVSVIAR